MIHVVDYGLGNILAFQNIYKRLNIEVAVAKTAADLELAKRVILPGVGAFDHAMELLDRSQMRSKLTELVMEKKIPVMGVCVGMQMLADSSDEGVHPGLGWIRGRVRHFAHLGKKDLMVPHMGWNDVRPNASCQIFSRLESEARFYFLHSYFFECYASEDAAAHSEYGIDFACAVQHENIFGVQFHPEKSHHFGAQLLKNFAEL